MQGVAVVKSTDTLLGENACVHACISCTHNFNNSSVSLHCQLAKLLKFSLITTGNVSLIILLNCGKINAVQIYFLCWVSHAYYSSH